jgi:lipopolysaccharide transport protein LptA
MNEVVRQRPLGLAGKAVLLLAVWVAAAILMALLWVKESDITAARREVRREKAGPSDDAPAMVPRISREDFEFRLPIPGEKGKYQWKVKGDKAVSVDANTDKIFGFRGEMIDRGEPLELSSETVLFDKEKRVLSTNDDVVLKAPWARIESHGMLMEMATNDAQFSGGVTTQIDREEAEKRQIAPSASDQKNAPPKATEKDEGKAKKKKKSPLVITSRELRLRSKQNLAIFTGEVLAKDDSGTISAERMEAQNYSQEETKKDPKLKGVKKVICTGDVKIDQVEGKKQARCARAEYDAATNIIHLYYDPKTGKKVVYRDEEQKIQTEAEEMTIDRTTSVVEFKGEHSQVKTVDFNPDRKSFLGFMEPPATKPDKPKPEPGSGK